MTRKIINRGGGNYYEKGRKVFIFYDHAFGRKIRVSKEDYKIPSSLRKALDNYKF